MKSVITLQIVAVSNLATAYVEIALGKQSNNTISS